jgi:hypothetical protein
MNPIIRCLGIIAQATTPASPSSSAEGFLGISPDLLLGLVKAGEFGSAVAMLILGFYLHRQASQAPLAEISARQGVAKQFMRYAALLFVLCCIVEVAKLLIPEPHPKVKAMIAVPPLNETNYEQYGKIEIVRLDSSDQKQDKQHASSFPSVFWIHDNSTITIDVSPLTTKLTDTKRVIDSSVTKEKDVGPDAPK